MTEIKLYKTTTKGLKIIGMCLPFVAVGIWMIMQESIGSTSYIMGWGCTCFFGLGIPVGLFQIFDKRPQIIITENGIWDRTTRQEEVKWEQIIDVYPLDIHGQKFISLVTDNTFVFKKEPYKLTTKITEFVGAQNINLYLGQIDLDETELTNFIKQLTLLNDDERRKSIKRFKAKRADFSASDLQNVFIYVLISILLLFVSISSFTVFMSIMIVMGISGATSRWRPNNLTIRKYAGIVTWLGFVNMVLCFRTIKLYNTVAENVGEKLLNQIESFKGQNATVPRDIKSTINKLDLNFFERYFADKIEYSVNDNDYVLKADMLFGKRRKYDRNSNEWK